MSLAFISIVTTLYKSENYIDDFYKRVSNTVAKITNDYEIIFIDDGSPDKSSEIAKKISLSDKKVKLAELSRNFGHHVAMMIGLKYASGDYIFLIDSDLEEPPELLETFFTIMQKNVKNIDVVYGVLEKRKGNLLESIGGSLFYKLYNFLSGVYINEGTLVVRLMKNSYVKNLLLYNESNVFILGLMQLNGFNQLAVPVKKTSKGSSVYSFIRKLSLATDAITSFSNQPLFYVSVFGLIMSMVSFMIILWLLMGKIFSNEILSGWTSVMVSIWLVGGLIITAIGIVGIYIGKIFVQVKNRPNAIIKNTYNL